MEKRKRILSAYNACGRTEPWTAGRAVLACESGTTFKGENVDAENKT